MLIVDDLSYCDGLTQRTIIELARVLGNEPVLLVTAGDHDRGVLANEMMRLDGLGSEEAERFLAGSFHLRLVSGLHKLTESLGGSVLPLHLEQLEALGVSPDDGPPPRLADAIAQRIERADVDAQRLLQSAAVLGRTCDLDALRAVSGDGELTGLDELSGSSLVVLDGSQVSIVHPFIADLVEASIPAEARRQLHRRAYEVLSGLRAPQEVRAAHAFRGVEPVTSLVVLEKAGDASMARGDHLGAVLEYRRALEIARRETLESGDTVYDRAIATFSRKLGEALARSGDAAGADGVLREAIAAAGGPGEAVQLIENTDRSLIGELLTMKDTIDLVVPRGGAELIKFVAENATMPVLTGGIGVCHTYVDRTADLEKAVAITLNAKTRKVSICNALDTLVDIAKNSDNMIHKVLALRGYARLIEIGRAHV